MLSNVFLHLHPVRIRKSGVKLRYTWCMGGLSFFLFLSLTLTGLLLMFYYRPTLEYAYTDIVGLREHVPLGIMREMHRWGAHAMVIAVWLHMFRVFMTGSYKPPREFNWSVGVIMLVLTLLLSFTGYLLPWDQLAIWAITVGSNMARATPFLGHEGPGAQLLRLGDVPLIHAGDDARFALLGGTFVGRGRAAAVLRAALRRPAARDCRADGGALLARAEGRRDFGTTVETETCTKTRKVAEDLAVCPECWLLALSSRRASGSHQRRLQRGRRSAAVLPARGGGTRGDRVEARSVRVQRRRLRPARRARDLLRLRHLRSELPARS